MIDRLHGTKDDLIIGRNRETGTLIINCAGGSTIEVHPGGQISVSADGTERIEGVSFRWGTPDALPSYMRS